MNNQNRKGKVVGIIMTYNCAHLLEDTFHRLPQGVFDELIISDDGSKDNVKEIAEKIINNTQATPVYLYVNEHKGYGGNLRNGLKKAVELGGEYMVEIHGDGQFDQSITPVAVEKMERDDLDFLIGSRFTNLRQPLKNGMPLPRYFANIGLSFIERIVLRIPWTEFHPGFRMYRRRFIGKFMPVWQKEKVADDYLFSFQIIAFAAWISARCGEVPVRADYHKAHTSVGYYKAAVNSFQEMGVLFWYTLAKFGLKNGIFK